MILAELQDSARPLVALTRTPETSRGAWAAIQIALQRGIVGGDANRLDVRADVFLSELRSIRSVRDSHGERFQYGTALTALLQRLAQERRSLQRVRLGSIVRRPVEQLIDQLEEAGFTRELRDFQLENLATLLSIPHAADFSVPGAGKTSVALAGFALHRSEGRVEQALVVAPIAAFEAWQEESANLFQQPLVVAVHTGSEGVLPSRADLILTNYNRLASDYDRLRDYVARRPTQVILDEAHRIKRGADGVHGRAALDLAHVASRRDILTGTPAPQGAHDLVALMGYLYPGQDREILPAGAYDPRMGRDPVVLSSTQAAINAYFVRTPKARLGLPPTRFRLERQPMGAIQAAIYDSLVGSYADHFRLEGRDRHFMRRLGRVVMYLLEAASNPQLLSAGSDPDDDLDFQHPPLSLAEEPQLLDLLARYASYETPWKFTRIAEIVEAATQRGEKVLVWSTFVRNLKALERLLQRHQPAVVHGGVPPQIGAPAGARTREGEFSRFKNDPACNVLLANPAACGEGVSLHHWCHEAVYLDRTFNAGSFLQSQDRIHRLGLADGQLTTFTILTSIGTIDETVDQRLREKITALAALLDDPGLVEVSLPDEEEPFSAPPVEDSDLEALVRHLGSD